MRDLERWKDKVELSLDGRQIFFLFFGTAVAVCLVFVAGVLVGKRLEARALALTPPPVEDPLAALDQLGEADDADESLTYHKALTRDRANPPKAAEAKPLDAPKAFEVVANINAADAKPAPKAATPKPASPAADASKPAPPSLADAPAPKPPAKVAAAADDARADDGAAAIELPRLPKPAAPLPAGKPQVVAAAPGAGQAPAKKADVQRFTLQLSAFPERADAEEFMRKIQSAGYKPFLVVSEIPGKGVFYRVRVGDYGTRDAAANAKAEFERKQRMIAYVAKL